MTKLTIIKEVVETKQEIGEYIPYQGITDMVPFEDRAMACAIEGVSWTVGTALPFVLQGGCFIVGKIIQGIAKGVWYAFRPKPKRNQFNYPPSPMGRNFNKPNVHVTTNVKSNGGNVYIENNIEIW